MSKNDLDAVEIAQKQRHLYLLNRVKNNRHLSQSELKELKKLEGKKRKTKDEGRGTKTKSALAASEIIKTQGDAAKYARVSKRTIRRWVQAGMPKTEHGCYIKAMLDFYKENEGNQPTEAKAKGQAADADYKDAKARLMQMELELKQGKLVPIENIEAGRIRRILAVKRALLGLGRKMAPQLAKIKDERKIAAVINAETRDMIEGFASP